jgi:hypothetical protein
VAQQIIMIETVGIITENIMTIKIIMTIMVIIANQALNSTSVSVLPPFQMFVVRHMWQLC